MSQHPQTGATNQALTIIGMGYLDIIFIILFAGGAVIGYRKGALKQIGSLAGVVAGIIACQTAGEWASGIAGSIIGANEPDASELTIYTAKVLGYGCLFGVTWLGIWLIASFLRKATRALLLRPVDSVAGSLFLIFKWFLVLSLMLNFWKTISPQSTVFNGAKLAGGALLDTVMHIAPITLGYIKDFATNTTGALF